MKNYIVAIISFFENNIKQFKIEAESEYEAVKKAMVEFCTTEDAKKSEIEFQNSGEYPIDIQELSFHYANCDMDFSVIEIEKQRNTSPRNGKFKNVMAYVTDNGDLSVGILAQTWELQCPFYSDADADEKEHYRNAIADVYKEFAEGKIVVQFDYEIKDDDFGEF